MEEVAKYNFEHLDSKINIENLTFEEVIKKYDLSEEEIKQLRNGY